MIKIIKKECTAIEEKCNVEATTANTLEKLIQLINDNHAKMWKESDKEINVLKCDITMMNKN